MHLIERAGDLADFVARHHVDRDDLQARGSVRGLAKPTDPLRQLHCRDVERVGPQPAQRQHQGPGDE
jgi:hypothetical protein